MKPQEQSPHGNKRQWLIAGAAIAGVAVLAFLLLAPGPVPEVSEAPGSGAGDQTRPIPRLSDEALRAGTTAAAGPLGDTPFENSTACRACREKNRGTGCNKDMGCDGLQGQDRTLCEELLTCLSAHQECFTRNPVLCYCGAAQGLACVKAPQGPCAKQALAATKTTDLTEAARRFFIPEFPSGRASQVAACGIRACKTECGILASARPEDGTR
jgi:hypothetical protein